MCGRFTLRTKAAELAERFLFEPVDGAADWSPRFNIAPTQSVAAVRMKKDRDQRELAQLRWGLIPSWAKDPTIGNRMINARAETIADKPAFRAAFRRRRCLVLADGYYEWQKTDKGKQPFHIRMRDGRAFAMAGLWEIWHGDGDPVHSCTVITTAANDLTAPLHDRMPVILHDDDCRLWLAGDESDLEKLQQLLQPFDSGEMAAMAVSTFVNNVRNQGEKCLEP